MKTHILAPHGRHSVCGLQWAIPEKRKGAFVGENAATCNLCRRGRQGQRRRERNPMNELKQIDDLLYDASADFSASEVEHQIDCHADTLPEFTRRLAEHLRKINAVGEARRQEETKDL